MQYNQFIKRFRNAEIRVDFDRKRAGQYLSARLLLPMVILPVLGLGVGLTLLGKVWIGLAVIALGSVSSRLIKRSAPHFLLAKALEDETVFNELFGAGILRVYEIDADAPEIVS